MRSIPVRRAALTCLLRKLCGIRRLGLRDGLLGMFLGGERGLFLIGQFGFLANPFLGTERRQALKLDAVAQIRSR